GAFFARVLFQVVEFTAVSLLAPILLRSGHESVPAHSTKTAGPAAGLGPAPDGRRWHAAEHSARSRAGRYLLPEGPPRPGRGYGHAAGHRFRLRQPEPG